MRDRRRFYPSTLIHQRSPKDLMPVDEIRQWCRLLHEEHGWPWESLGRTLGIGEGKHVASKVRGNSLLIYRAEHIRMSRALAQIISGQLFLGPPNKHGRRDALIADNPQLIGGATRMAYDFKQGRIVWRVPPTPEPTLPSFLQAIGRLLGPKCGERFISASITRRPLTGLPPSG